MKHSLFKWQLAGFIFTGIAGVLLHFLFDWTGSYILVAPFSAVNESIFEHLKLLFFPMLLFSLAEYYFAGNVYNNFWCIKAVCMILGLVLIPVLYYTINGVFGSTPDWINIAIFFVVAGVSYSLETYLFWCGQSSCPFPGVALAALLIIGLLFVVLTFLPLHIPLFQDPVSGSYGYFQLR